MKVGVPCKQVAYLLFDTDRNDRGSLHDHVSTVNWTWQTRKELDCALETGTSGVASSQEFLSRGALVACLECFLCLPMILLYENAANAGDVQPA